MKYKFDKVLIGGEWMPAAKGTYPIIDPATEEVVGAAPQCSVEQVQQAARAAHNALYEGPWAKMSGAERGKLLNEAAERFRKETPNLIDLTIAETGALRRVAETQQVGAVAARLAKYAVYAGLPSDEGMAPIEVSPAMGGGLANGMVVHDPVGVVACITPFNFPMTNCAGKVGPALACGNTVVVKPAPSDPLGVAELCRIMDSVLPPGVVNFVCGTGPEIGAALSTSPDVDMISFTGSTQVGARIGETCAAQMKRTLLELGGKSANIVFADCNREKAVRSAMNVWTFHTGQICIAGTRLLVEQSIYDEFTAQLAKAGPLLKIGDPREEGVVVGPLATALQRDRVSGYVETGVAEGAVLACGGKRPSHLAKGYYFEPTLLTGVNNHMAIAREEIFGPVIAAIPFRDEAEAIAIANDSDFGLYGYVWSGDTARAVRVARKLRTGTVQINGAPPNPDAPFGGFKMSGLGRDGGKYGMSAYSEIKYVGWTA